MFATGPIKEMKILPALDRAGHMPISWAFLLSTLLVEYLPKPLARLLGITSTAEPAAWLGAPVRPPKPTPSELLRTNVRTTSIPNDIMQRVLTVCRSKHVRLTGLLGRLVARALAQTLRARGAEHTKFLACTAMDLRRALGQGYGCIANYPSGITDVYDIPVPSDGKPLGVTAEDWDTARLTTEHLSRASISLSDHPIALLRYLTNIRSWVEQQAVARAENSFELSNLGVFGGDLVAEDDWDVEDMVFGQSADGTNGPMNFNVASTKQGSLNIVTTWWPGMLGVEDEGAFVDETLERIRVLMGGIV